MPREIFPIHTDYDLLIQSTTSEVRGVNWRPDDPAGYSVRREKRRFRLIARAARSRSSRCLSFRSCDPGRANYFQGFSAGITSRRYIGDSRHACTSRRRHRRSMSFQFKDKGKLYAENKIDRRGRGMRENIYVHARVYHIFFSSLPRFSHTYTERGKNRDEARAQKLTTEKPDGQRRAAKLVVPQANTRGTFSARVYIFCLLSQVSPLSARLYRAKFHRKSSCPVFLPRKL